MSNQSFALKLIDWHGGQSSGLYSVGSTMLSHCLNGTRIDWTALKPGVQRAIHELRNLKRDANFPECVTPSDESECNKLADKLERKLTS